MLIKNSKSRWLNLVGKTVFTAALLFGFDASAQVVNHTVLQQPCDGDGKIAVQVVSGMTAPINYIYYDNSGHSFMHSNVGSSYDTLYNIKSSITYLYVYDNNGNSYSGQVYAMHDPFVVDKPVVNNAICPSTIGSASFTINAGFQPASVDWYNSNGGTYFATGNPMSLPVGGYAVVITDGNGCKVYQGDSGSFGGVYIEYLSGLSFTVDKTTASCTNGTASVNGVTGGPAPYSYQWSNGANTPGITGLQTGIYQVTVTDAQGCSRTEGEIYVPQSVQINVNNTTTAATCVEKDGSTITFASGGVPPYTYTYSNGMSGQTLSGLEGGSNFTVTVSDANNCIGTGYIYVGTTSPVYVNYTTTPSSCSAPTGSATLDPQGGTAPYTVVWYTTGGDSALVLTNKPAGTYSFRVVDAVGCVVTGSVVIPPVSTINVTIDQQNPICPSSTGSLAAYASGSNPPFNITWNGVVGASIVAPLGSYVCRVEDAVGCTVYKVATVYQQSPISLGFNSTDASCIYTQDGSIGVNPMGGTAPYNYSWSNGATGSTITGLAANTNYYVSVSDANGCHASSHKMVGYNSANDNCYCTITGKVYVDANNNCTQDVGERGVEHVMIHCSGYGYAFTNQDGEYFFQVPTGSYTISESVQYMYPLASCQNNAIALNVTAASGCTNTVNFANNELVIRDIHVLRTSCMFPIPGNSYTEEFIVTNDGTVNEPAVQLSYRTDGRLPLVGISAPEYVQTSDANYYTTSSNISLAPGETKVVVFDYQVPTDLALGTPVLAKDTGVYEVPVSNWLNDYSPWNNVRDFSKTVIGSYDPNFKEVFPVGKGTEGYIQTTDSVLEYVVHFQNTGSYYANKVVVIDTLDTDLDWSTLKPGYSDHNYVASLSDNGVLRFTFNNIHLTWQDDSELGSRGLVTYTIKQKAGLSPATQIKNKAAIYFDYNEPVITNEVLNTIAIPDGITETGKSNNLLIYPNPASDFLMLKLDDQTVKTINIYDIQGRKMETIAVTANQSAQKVSLSGLVKGLYILEIENTNGSKASGKFIKN